MKPMYVNIDINTVTTPFLNFIAEKEHPEQYINYFVDQYKDTHVTDLLFNIFCQYSAVDSNVFTTYADKYLQKEENGEKVDYTGQYEGIYKLNKTYGIDPYAAWIDRCKEIGIRPWLSVRMNDVHDNFVKSSFLRSAFYYEAQKNGWILGDEYYSRAFFDYKVDAVRKIMRDYIREQILRYDVYGIELDFMREIKCFKFMEKDYDPAACTEIMTEFIRQVKADITEAEEKWGHPIKIMVRTTRSVHHAYGFGFDHVTWAKEKLVDIIVPSFHITRGDSNMPIAEWIEKLPGVEVTAGMDINVTQTTLFSAELSQEAARGWTAGYLAEGSEGIYLFNYFTYPVGYEGIVNPITYDYQAHLRSRKVMTECDLEDIYAGPARFVLMGQDHVLRINDDYPLWQPLPMTLSPEGGEQEIFTGEIPEDKTVSLIAGFPEQLPADLELRVNGVPCTGFEEVDLEQIPGMEPQPRGYIDIFGNTKCYRCEVPHSALRDRKQIVSLKAAEGVLEWLELDMV